MKIGIIGFGNLGRALASGLIKSGHGGALYVCETAQDKRDAARGAPFHAHVSEDVNFVIENSDILFLVVKSYVFEEMVGLIDKNALIGKTVVSFMAGVTLEDLHALVGKATSVVAIPSLAISECDGVIGYTKAPAEVTDIFNKLGHAIETAPEDIAKVMAFASCGLGFAAYLIDAFAAAGQTMGFCPEDCGRIAALTFKSAVERGAPFRDTVKAVATPGGITEQGLLYFDECGVYDIVAQAMRKAYERVL